ncbi:hypothetical protein [Nioella aestuarii]|uniref:hypothetical protein n=1 Tax=Nioella aestuarii TaxID=1662864 RepID=UPI003D7F5D76
MDSEIEGNLLPEKPTIDDRLAAWEAAQKGVIIRDHQGQTLRSRDFWVYIALDIPALHGPIGLVGLVLDLLAAGRAEEARPLSGRLVSVARNAYRDFWQLDKGSGRHTDHMEPIVEGLIAKLSGASALGACFGTARGDGRFDLSGEGPTGAAITHFNKISVGDTFFAAYGKRHSHGQALRLVPRVLGEGGDE